MHKVSVVIPAYNAAPYLREAIDSALNQTHTQLEIIIVDDGSTDNTYRIAEEYQKLDPARVHIVSCKNAGVSAARNEAMRMATGDYIAFLDADDIWLPNKIAKQLDAFRMSPDSSFSYCDCFFIDTNLNVIENYVRTVKLVEGNIFYHLFMNFFVITSGVMVSAKAIKEIGYFDEALHVGEDYDYFLRLAKKFTCVVCIEKLFKRRVHAKSLSRQDYELDARNGLGILQKIIANDPAFYATHRASIRRMLADHHFELSYNLLNHGKRWKALSNSIVSFNYRPSAEAFKSMVAALLPTSFRRNIQNKN